MGHTAPICNHLQDLMGCALANKFVHMHTNIHHCNLGKKGNAHTKIKCIKFNKSHAYRLVAVMKRSNLHFQQT